MSIEPAFTANADWELCSLGEICSEGGGGVQTGPFGSQLHASDYVSTGTPSVMPTNIGDNRIDDGDIARITDSDLERLAKYELRIGDIVYSRRGDVEKRSLIREREDGWLCGTGCLRVRPGNHSKVSPEYLAHYLGHPAIRSWIVRHAIGATMPNLNTSIMSDVPVWVPPRETQESITSLLCALDDKIELSRRMNETLEEMALAIFKSWFVDFDPVRAKTEGRQPYGMDADTAALFPDSFQDSEVGHIPKGWEVQALEKVCELAYGKALKASDREAGVVPVYGSNGAIGYHGVALVDGPGIVVGRKGNPGIVTWSDYDFFPIDTTFYVRPKQSSYGLHFLFYALRTLNLEQFGSDSAVPGLSRRIAYMSEMVTPTPELIAAFAETIAPLFERKRCNNSECQTLAELRDTLLPKLLSGEVRIRDASDLAETSA